MRAQLATRLGRWRPQLLLAVLVAAVAAVAGSAFVVQRELRTVWAAGFVAAAAVAALFVPTLWEALRQQLTAQHRLLTGRCLLNPHTGRLPRIIELDDPVELGVHPAADLSIRHLSPPRKLGRVPVYVPRDIDRKLDDALDKGGFVLVVGDSTAGKTRTAYEAMRRRLHDRWLLVPKGRADLRALLNDGLSAQDMVVWLDDLERYLGQDGLDTQLLRRLLGDGSRRVVVLATIRTVELAAIREQEHGDREDLHADRTLLDQVVRIDLPRKFTPAEHKRAQEWKQDDPRIADALAHTDYGLAEYLAAGPKLLIEWKDARQTGSKPDLLAGAALVAGGVDCRRAGLDEPVPARALKKLARRYLDKTDAGLLDRDAFERGLRWATKRRYGASALLTRQVDDRYLAFDYLVDTLQRDPDAPAVPDHVWRHVIAAAGPITLTDIGWRAEQAKRPECAELAYRKAYKAANGWGAPALHGLARLANAGYTPALDVLRKAASDNAPSVLPMLGELYEGSGYKLGDLGVAGVMYDKATEGDNPGAMSWLGDWAWEQGKQGDAAAWYEKAAREFGRRAEAGQPWAMDALRKAADAGNPWAKDELRRLTTRR